MGFAQLKTATLEETRCCVCATRFAVDEIIMDYGRRNAGSIYCPNGHRIGWEISEAENLKKLLAAETQRANMEAASRRTAEEESRKAQDALKRVSKRVNAGVCPHCKRTFKQLSAHMKCKHNAEVA